MIESKDLSFVIIGDPNESYLDKTISSIKQFYPDSEIILSTCIVPNRDISNDITVCLNQDPGPLIDKLNGHEANKNLNRMIVNSRNGCAVATRKYVVRLRNDLIFHNNNLLSFYQKFIENDLPRKEKTVVIDKIMVCDTWTMHPFSNNGLSFHPSDWLMMSSKASLVEYFSIPLKKAEEISNSESKVLHRNEQYLFLCNVWKRFPSDSVNIKYDVDTWYPGPALQFLLHNFFVSNRYELGFNCLKYPNLPPSNIWSYSSYQDLISSGY